MNRADSIVGNTGQQCSAQEISRSEYTNYTCERDLQVEQYCTRTARMELQGSTTWETRTLEYEMSQLPAREVNGQYVVSITSPLPVKLSMRITAGVVLTCRRVYL